MLSAKKVTHRIEKELKSHNILFQETLQSLMGVKITKLLINEKTNSEISIFRVSNYKMILIYNNVPVELLRDFKKFNNKWESQIQVIFRNEGKLSQNDYLAFIDPLENDKNKAVDKNLEIVAENIAIELKNRYQIKPKIKKKVKYNYPTYKIYKRGFINRLVLSIHTDFGFNIEVKLHSTFKDELKEIVEYHLQNVQKVKKLRTTFI
ncbi:hypothetical protein BVX95_00810 [archaeon D22]|nr:hypothetical protein BVX95_00810 [archaeon D22]